MMAIAAILRRDHHWSGNFLQDGGEEIYRNGTEGSNPACSSGESTTNPSSTGTTIADTTRASTISPRRRLLRARHPILVERQRIKRQTIVNCSLQHQLQPA